MTSEMIDRVTRAIFDAMDIADGLDGTVAEKYARAAIEALTTDDLLKELDRRLGSREVEEK